MSDAFNVTGAGADLASALRAVTVSLLKGGNTLALQNVEDCRDAAFTSDDDPASISVYTPKINRTWRGGSPPMFDAKVYLSIIGRIAVPVLEACTVMTDTLRVQIENAVLCAPAFWAAVQSVNTIDSTIEFPGTGELHEGVLTMVLECQCVDTFAPIAGVPFETAGLTVPNQTMPAADTTASNLIGATITIPQGD